jgi:2-polyprenyl-3-methyl-5-hydroxy-6-metoxy-1,4-benzoquinol methylase
MTLTHRQCSTTEEAVRVLGELVQQQDGGDANYFRTQLNRYVYSIERITKLRSKRCRVLDIGSHYLHQSVLLSLLGYEVWGLDVPLFTEPSFIRERAEAMGITNVSSEAHQSGEFLQEHDGGFDLIVCTEMLEHIAFNPVAFWQRVWRLLADGGMIYVTTPNSFRLRALLKTLGRLITFEGIGLPVDEILTVITYGHHWKEYSSRELTQYFQALSPDFVVETHTYPDAESQRNLFSRVLEILPPLRTNIEVIVRLQGKTTFATPPVLPMMLKSKTT